METPLQQREMTRPAADLVTAASAFSSDTLHEAAGKLGALPSGITPVSPAFRLCGPAFTVLSSPGDNLWLHRAMVAAEPGDILVADVGGHYEAGYWGEIMTHGALSRGLGGVVIDGCVRDGPILRELGLPVFSRGLCIRGTTKNKQLPGGMNVSLRIGDVPVEPGDLVLGDEDGVVVISQATLPEVLAQAKARDEKEAKVIEELKAGRTTVQLYDLG